MFGVNERSLFLVCGLPGAGKTTRSRQIVVGFGSRYVGPNDEWAPQ
jgi:predicted kinase